MPQPATDPSPSSSSTQPCSRCTNPSPTQQQQQQQQQQTYLLRTEYLCAACLQSWLLTRLARRITSGFHIPGGTRSSVRRILLPLSGGLSSLALLELLSRHTAVRMARTGRAGYVVVGCWVDEGVAFGDVSQGAGFGLKRFEDVKARYAERHGWIMHRVAVEDILAETGGLDAQSRTRLLDALPLSDAQRALPPREMLRSILLSLTSPSARADLLASLRMRMVVSIARREECSIVTWADTTTRLAEKTLAQTAAGRGCALPWLTGDSVLPDAAGNETGEGLGFMYPLQDLYRSEVRLWAEVCDTGIPTGTMTRDNTSSNAAVPAVSSKDLTIDELMGRYFRDVEIQYPSVVANVVRTANKLPVPGSGVVAGTELVSCDICSLPFTIGDASRGGSGGGIESWEGNQRDFTSAEVPPAAGYVGGIIPKNGETKGSVESTICYACLRTIEKARVGIAS